MAVGILTVVLAICVAAGCKKDQGDATPACDASVAQPAAKKRGRSAPICARQDCATKQIVDDGCHEEGRCLACVNPCDLH